MIRLWLLLIFSLTVACGEFEMSFESVADSKEKVELSEISEKVLTPVRSFSRRIVAIRVNESEDNDHTGDCYAAPLHTSNILLSSHRRHLLLMQFII